MKVLSFILCFLMVFQTTVFAAGKSTTLKKNQKAPFPGTLLDAKAIAEILAIGVGSTIGIAFAIKEVTK